MWILILLVMLGTTLCRVKGTVVKAPAGLIRGLRVTDENYTMFLGVPYAQVQEDNPFGPSIPVTKFEKVFYANDDSVVCPQVEEFFNKIVGALDCLRLNIFVPNEATPTNKLPVLVWIHGGRFQFGSGNRYQFGPKFLIRHGIILVSMNYRVGPYGFFCLDIPEVPGNQGLKDQYMALRWIKNNIPSFGGDENKITMMGDSAGGSSIDYHMISKQELLFNQAILQSGNIFCTDMLTSSDPSMPLRIAEQLGFKTNNLYEALSHLTKTDVKSVINATNSLSLRIKPCVEKKNKNVEHILADYPMNLGIPNVKRIPLLMGSNSKESLCTFANKPVAYLNNNLTVFDKYMKRKFNYDRNFLKTKDIVRQFYIGQEEISEDVKSEIIDFVSDIRFVFPVQMTIRRYLENDAAKIFQYLFSYSGGKNFVKNRENVTTYGAAHGDILGYLFEPSYDQSTPSKADQLMIDRITTLWTNFVKYGDPVPATSELLPLKWPPVSKNNHTYLELGPKLRIGRGPFHDRIAFWEVFYRLNEKSVIPHQAISVLSKNCNQH